MRVAITLSALAAAFGLTDATIYFAGDSTMAKNGANDGSTDGKPPRPQDLSLLRGLLTNKTLQAGAPTLLHSLTPTPPSSTKPLAAAPPAATRTKAASPRSLPCSKPTTS